MSEFTRKLALIAAVVLVPAGLALGAVALSSDTGAPPVRVEDATVDLHSPTGQQGRTSSSSSPTSSPTSTSPSPGREPTSAPPAAQPAPARTVQPVPVQPVQPVVPYYADDWDDDWDDEWDDDGDDWDDDRDD